MAINQASFFLFPPRHGPAVEWAGSARTATGKPLALVSSTLADPAAPKVTPDDCRRWFLARGFVEKERYGSVCRLWYQPVTTFLGRQGEIELPLVVDEAEVGELYLRFLLTDATPAAVPRWAELVAELGHDFGFRLMDEDHALLPCLDFRAVLRTNENYRSYQKHFGWGTGFNA